MIVMPALCQKQTLRPLDQPSDCGRWAPPSVTSVASRERIVPSQAAEIAALLGFEPVRTWSSGRGLVICCAGGQSPLRYSVPVRNRRRFPRADDTNGRWDSLRTAQRVVPSGRATDCDRTARLDRRRRTAVFSKAERKTAVPTPRL